MWPSSWNWRSLRSTTAKPRWMSDAVGSIPSLIRSDRPVASLRRKSASVMRSTAPVRTIRSCSSTGSAGPGMTPERYRLRLGSPGTNQRHGCSSPRPGERPMRVDTPGVSGGGHAVVEQPERAPHEVEAVVLAGEPERLAEARRPGEEIAVAPGLRPPLAHHLDPGDGRGGAQEHRGGVAVLGGDHVGAPVHPVGEVHVEAPGRTEHHLGARGHAPVGVAAGVVGAAVRLDLHQAGDEARAVGGAGDEELVEQQRGELARVAGVERPRQRPAAWRATPRRLGAQAGSCSQRACSSSRARAFTSCSATDAGPGAAGRRAPEDGGTGLQQRERLGPEVGFGQHELVEGHAPLGRAAHQRADACVRLAEGHAPLHQPLGEVDGGGVLAVGRRLHARLDHLRRGQQPRDRSQREAALVERVEQRLLVLLEVAVVRERAGP